MSADESARALPSIASRSSVRLEQVELVDSFGVGDQLATSPMGSSHLRSGVSSLNKGRVVASTLQDEQRNGHRQHEPLGGRIDAVVHHGSFRGSSTRREVKSEIAPK